MDPSIIQSGIALLTVLGGINAFFIKGLISKIDKVDRATTKYEEQIIQLKQSIEMISVFIKELSDLKSEVAVIKYALNRDKGE